MHFTFFWVVLPKMGQVVDLQLFRQFLLWKKNTLDNHPLTPPGLASIGELFSAKLCGLCGWVCPRCSCFAQGQKVVVVFFFFSWCKSSWCESYTVVYSLNSLNVEIYIYIHIIHDIPKEQTSIFEQTIPLTEENFSEFISCLTLPGGPLYKGGISGCLGNHWRWGGWSWKQTFPRFHGNWFAQRGWGTGAE